MRSSAAPLALSAVALLACSGALVACSGGGLSGLGGVLPQQSKPASRHRAASATPTPSPIPFTFQTVDDSTSTTNEVNAIDSSAEIAGTIGNGNASSPYQGYTSFSPYSTFNAITYSGASGIVVTALSATASRTTIAGFVISPPQLLGTWGFVTINGVTTLIKDRKEGKKAPDAVTELLGVNDSQQAVGFFKNTSGTKVPVVLNIPQEKFTPLKPPGGANGAEATGINDVGDIVGWLTSSNGDAGFFERLGTYYSLTYPSAKTTQALGLNGQDQVVGSYQDSKGVTHGFVLSDPSGGASGQVWQKIDDPKAGQVTIVTGINADDDICGYYIDSSGVQHGFVAVPNAS